ncbi:hypothetical protein [Nocardia goodfellowii]|uniref:Uncharacterized protein n=1 Tax=Nocardia goodfellowii TaxID=882446 RepID=A0ABS4QGJ3_9NOCA|nr:hypothetical protein [Nocardia goodfellowii]MBP2190802.1 hypothetical protein [Nocardia goodfellowii]
MTYPPGFGGGPYPQRDPDRWGQEPEWVSWPDDAPKVDVAPSNSGFPAATAFAVAADPTSSAAEIPALEADSGRGPGRFVALALTVLLVLTAGSAFFLFRGNGSSTEQAAGTTSSVSGAPSMPRPSKQVPVLPGDRFSYAEFGMAAWNFKFGNIELHADWVDGRDYESCRDIERDAKLTALGCQYASELAYRTENDGLMLTQFVLTMPDEATAAAAQDKFTGKDLRLRPGSYVPDYAVGKWKTEAKKNFLVVTVATATVAVTEAVVDKYLRYRHTDTALALMFR